MQRPELCLTMVLALAMPSSVDAASSANATASATATVIASIAVAKVSDLAFGVASPGDAALTVSPGNAENAQNASFNVTGQPNTAYSITLPTSVTMITGTGGTNQTIVVNNFVSTPAAGVNAGLIGSGGSQMLYVGATRAALSASQVAGNYSATFTVTVSY